MKGYMIKEERPGYLVAQNKASQLSDAQLLSVLANDKPNSVEVIRNKLGENYGLRQFIDNIENINGINQRTKEKFLASLELGKRYLEAQVRAMPALSDPDKTKTYVKAWLCRYPHEVFACMFLNNRHRVIANEILFTGTIDAANVYPREVLKRSLQLNASAIIFAHNHPSGIAEPSQADRNITIKLTQALEVLDVRVLDHLVVGETHVVSMAERGLM